MLQICFMACLIWFLTSLSTIFQLCQDGSSWVEPVLRKDKCFLLKDTTQLRRWCSNPRPFGLEASTLPLNHCAPIMTCTANFSTSLWLVPPTSLTGLNSGIHIWHYNFSWNRNFGSPIWHWSQRSRSNKAKICFKVCFMARFLLYVFDGGYTRLAQ